MTTSDVYLAATLLALGYRLENVDRKDPRHMRFEFANHQRTSNLGNVQKDIDEHNLETIETQWANRTLMVNAFDQAEAIKRMKSIIHSNN